MTNFTDAGEFAAIEYHGISGATQDCLNAVMRLLQFGNEISRTRILTCSNEHGLLLTIDVGDLVAIKSGFTSGYGGEGPRGFSRALELLRAHGSEIEEYDVPSALMQRLDSSALTLGDLAYVDAARPVRPSRLADYVSEKDFDCALSGTLWRDFPPTVPFAIVDNRIMDLALSFWTGPDDRLLKGYRRLEDLVRRRTGLNERGSKLFSQAFGGKTSVLYWRDITDGEQTGRVNLFTGAYMAHRSSRAHQELNTHPDESLAEFLVLNHLFRLEHKAEDRASSATDAAETTGYVPELPQSAAI